MHSACIVACGAVSWLGTAPRLARWMRAAWEPCPLPPARSSPLLASTLPAGGGVGAGGIALIVVLCVGVLSGAGYFAYQYRLRGLMQQEVRAIMSQYMVRPPPPRAHTHTHTHTPMHTPPLLVHVHTTHARAHTAPPWCARECTGREGVRRWGMGCVTIDSPLAGRKSNSGVRGVWVMLCVHTRTRAHTAFDQPRATLPCAHAAAGRRRRHGGGGQPPETPGRERRCVTPVQVWAPPRLAALALPQPPLPPHTPCLCTSLSPLVPPVLYLQH